MKIISTIWIIWIILIILIILIISICINLSHPLSESILYTKMNQIQQQPFVPFRFAVVTLETRDLTLLPYHNKNITDYCNRHGYDYFFLDKYENELELPIYWKKIQVVKEMLEKNYDYVVWMDSDTMICNYDIRFEQIVVPGKSIYMGEHFPIMKDNYNAGFFIIQNNKVGHQFLSDCIFTYLNRKECQKDGEYGLHGGWSGKCFEQGVMNELIKTAYKNDFYILGYENVINTTFAITDTFVLHLFSGLDKTKNEVSDIFKRISKDEKFKYGVIRHAKWLLSRLNERLSKFTS